MNRTPRSLHVLHVHIGLQVHGEIIITYYADLRNIAVPAKY